MSIGLGHYTPLATAQLIRRALICVGCAFSEGHPPPSGLETVAQDILMQLEKKQLHDHIDDIWQCVGKAYSVEEHWFTHPTTVITMTYHAALRLLPYPWHTV